MITSLNALEYDKAVEIERLYKDLLNLAKAQYGTARSRHVAFKVEMRLAWVNAYD